MLGGIASRIFRIPELLCLSRASAKIIRQNFMIWFVSNALGLGLVFGGIIGPSGAAAFNFITDFFPIINVFRIYRVSLHSPHISK